jgi:hypothetical protein
MTTRIEVRPHLLLRGAAVGLAWAAGMAMAQSPVGALSGKAEPGAVVVISNPETGSSREITVGAKGRYQLRHLPIGRYRVVIRHADGREDAPRLVDVHIGTTVPVQ